MESLVTDAFEDQVLISWHDCEALGIWNLSQFVSVNAVQSSEETNDSKLQAILREFDGVVTNELPKTPMKGPPYKITFKSGIEI